MNYTVGIDLGSTTTKAVVLDADGTVLGRGITNSRSNYDVACQVALSEALINTRFSLIAGELRSVARDRERAPSLLAGLERRFRAEQYRSQLRVLDAELRRFLSRLLTRPPAASGILDRILGQMHDEVDALYADGVRRKSDFFRDLAGSRYLALAETESRATGMGFDLLAGLFDKAILDVENSAEAAGEFEDHAAAALGGMPGTDPGLAAAVARVSALRLEQVGSVGTGYGRARLPFPEGRDRKSTRLNSSH